MLRRKLRKAYIKKGGVLHKLVFVHEVNGYYFLQEKVKNQNGRWSDRTITSFGKTRPVIWYPQLLNEKAETVLTKLPDESINLIITDPPYGIGFKGHRYRNIDLDEVFNDHSLKFLEGVGSEFERVLAPNSHCYIFTRWDVYPIMVRYFTDALSFDGVIVWDKDEGGHGMGDLDEWAPRYELVMKFSKGKRPLRGKRPSNVIRHKDIRFTGEPKISPTQKPRGLMEILIEKSSNMGEIVADFYGGSYSVPRAAMRRFRKSLGVELNPKTHDAGVSLVNRELHSDPEYKVDWTNVTNLDVLETAVV